MIGHPMPPFPGGLAPGGFPGFPGAPSGLPPGVCRACNTPCGDLPIQIPNHIAPTVMDTYHPHCLPMPDPSKVRLLASCLADAARKVEILTRKAAGVLPTTVGKHVVRAEDGVVLGAAEKLVAFPPNTTIFAGMVLRIPGEAPAMVAEVHLDLEQGTRLVVLGTPEFVGDVGHPTWTAAEQSLIGRGWTTSSVSSSPEAEWPPPPSTVAEEVAGESADMAPPPTDADVPDPTPVAGDVVP